eukprot:Mrub_12773.p1 GENE.Mrub_12773~~Mrub_12773.p1  ORF type:complete len:174 (+),score=14.12 Mrub_12773:2-523(+)
MKDKAEDKDRKVVTITIMGRDHVVLEKFTSELISNAKQRDVPVKGPVRMPRKRLVLWTRKGPTGNGSETYYHYEMRIYKRVVELKVSTELIKEITKTNIPQGVKTEIEVKDDEEETGPMDKKGSYRYRFRNIISLRNAYLKKSGRIESIYRINYGNHYNKYTTRSQNRNRSYR